MESPNVSGDRSRRTGEIEELLTTISTSIAAESTPSQDREVDRARLEERAQAGRAWLEMGLGEHASIAAFARFVLDLLTVGATPELLNEAIRAMSDEVEHARICFSIAHSLTGKSVSPGPMDLSDIRQRVTSTRDLLEAAILEGCFAETISSREAQAAFEATEQPAVRQALERIAQDESRHADLSWRFVEWLVKRYPEQQEEAVEIFTRVLAATRAQLTEPIPAAQTLERYGHLPPATKHSVACATLREVIVPRATLLLGQAIEQAD